MVATVSGALLVVALLLDWWGLPSAFDEPANLPSAAAFSAEAFRMSGEEFAVDAFEWFEFRDILWLVTGVAGFACGLIVLTAPRARAVPAAVAALLALAATILISLTLISPPDFADLGPKDGGKEFDFGVDLPLSREPGGFIALAAALGIGIGAVLALTARRTPTSERGR